MTTAVETDDDVVVMQMARKLRIAMEEPLYLQQHQQQPEFFVNPSHQEDAMLQLIILASEYPPDVLTRAVLMTNDDTLRLPIHLAWYVRIRFVRSLHAERTSCLSTGRAYFHSDLSLSFIHSFILLIHSISNSDTNAPLEIIRWLLESDPKKESILRPDKWGDLPLHTAWYVREAKMNEIEQKGIIIRQSSRSPKFASFVSLSPTFSHSTYSYPRLLCYYCEYDDSSRKEYHAVVELLLTQQTVFSPDKSMALPLHTACRYQASTAVMELLLRYQPLKQLFSPGPFQQLPLHIACRCQHADAVPVLLNYDKEQALIPDHTGRLPIHLAYLKQMDAETTIRCLLQAMLLGRSELKGLVLWKRDLHIMICCLELEERDTMTSYKLEVTRNALLVFLEQSVCLELVLWHYALLTGEPQDREAGRITSGAHVILPHVLSYLEGGPIDDIVEQIQK